MINQMKPVLFIIVGFLSSLPLYFFLAVQNKNSINSGIFKEERYKTTYKYINPLHDCEIYESKFPDKISKLEKDLQKLTDQKKIENKITSASVYYKDLNNGYWIGINEKEMYIPASMYKVPILITLFKMAEEKPELLETVITSTHDKEDSVSQKQNIEPQEIIEKNKKYTLLELANRMIIYSDNLAQDLLVEYINRQEGKVLETTITDFGNDFNAKYGEMRIVDYSAYFSSLYNASYLNQKYSNLALEMLSKSTYKNGLVAGVPENVTVAHKFGERFFEQNNEKQLHDCGIIYKENKPYLLCIMTKGTDFVKLSNYIKDVSKLVYDSI